MPKSKNIVLAKSERIYLTYLKEEDAPVLLKWFHDPSIFAHIRDMHYHSDLDEQARWVRQVNQDPAQKVFAVYYLADDRLIGDGGFVNINYEDRKAEVGLVIGEAEYHSRGLGTEMLWLMCKYGFEVLKLHNIIYESYAENEISLKTALKVGFKFMGKRRESRWLAGHFQDVNYSDLLVGDLLKPEWKPKKP